jgi:hypothetical protein
MLCDHDYEREVVHPESRVEELIGIDEKDDIFDGFFDDTGVGFYVFFKKKRSEAGGDPLIKKKSHLADGAEVPDRPRDLVAS